MQHSEALSKTGAAKRESAFTVFKVFLKLGCTSFGGPIAHLGYFREEFVNQRKWITDRAYADLVALCQFTPGPASSKVGIGIGLSQAGLPGAFAAWLAFTTPSALALILFGFGVIALGDRVDLAWLHGLTVVAVPVVAQSVQFPSTPQGQLAAGFYAAVNSPDECPAARRSQVQRFDDSDAFVDFDLGRERKIRAARADVVALAVRVCRPGVAARASKLGREKQRAPPRDNAGVLARWVQHANTIEPRSERQLLAARERATRHPLGEHVERALGKVEPAQTKRNEHSYRRSHSRLLRCSAK